ncbi:MAG: transglycosylase SLT domain-containing protein [Treponema sp.]|nr:transglycosylase SLT domain-containing protein [Treponema sp.]
MVCFLSIVHKAEPAHKTEAAEEVPSEDPPEIPSGIESSPPVFPGPGNKPDIILSSYRDEISRDRVVYLFGTLARSNEVAAIILTNANTFNIPPSLAFALCWEESRYNIMAVSRENRNGSIDRGLFQLNSLSFPQLNAEDFFNPSINAYYGLAHLRWCIDVGGSEIAGLAMYNAGTNRVRQNGTPKNTLDYISRVLAYQQRINEFFRSDYEYAMAISMSPR